MTKQIFVNLAVADVEKATGFYKAIGFDQNMQFSQPGVASSMVWSDAIYVMLLSHEHFSQFTPRPIADPRAASEVLIALTLESRAAVDAMIETAASSGGKDDVRAAQDMGFMYSRAFEDPDGHIFEPFFMDMEAAAAAMGKQPAEA